MEKKKINICFSFFKAYHHLLYIMLMFFISAGLTSCSSAKKNPPIHLDESSKISCRDQAEKFLEWHFSRCRNVHFQKSTLLGSYLTLIYFETPEEELKALLRHSPKLTDYEFFKKNETNLEAMKEIGRDLAWWDTNKLKNALCGTTSWCTGYCVGYTHNDNCILYAHSTVAKSRISGKWFAVFISFSDAMWPDMLPDEIKDCLQPIQIRKP
jgi:hypothetical protein